MGFGKYLIQEYAGWILFFTWIITMGVTLSVGGLLRYIPLVAAGFIIMITGFIVTGVFILHDIYTEYLRK